MLYKTHHPSTATLQNTSRPNPKSHHTIAFPFLLILCFWPKCDEYCKHKLQKFMHMIKLYFVDHLKSANPLENLSCGIFGFFYVTVYSFVFIQHLLITARTGVKTSLAVCLTALGHQNFFITKGPFFRAHYKKLSSPFC